MTKVTLGFQNNWRKALYRSNKLWWKSIRALYYLTKCGVGIITGGNKAGSTCKLFTELQPLKR